MQKMKNFMNSLSAIGALSEFIRKPRNSKKIMNSLSAKASLSEYIKKSRKWGSKGSTL